VLALLDADHHDHRAVLDAFLPPLLAFAMP
jgi:hypothetical protein